MNVLQHFLGQWAPLTLTPAQPIEAVLTFRGKSTSPALAWEGLCVYNIGFSYEAVAWLV